MSAVLGSIQQIADHAYFYCAARAAAREASGPALVSAVVLVDAALHDLTLCCGFPCTTCEENTCPGLILSGNDGGSEGWGYV